MNEGDEDANKLNYDKALERIDEDNKSTYRRALEHVNNDEGDDSDSE